MTPYEKYNAFMKQAELAFNSFNTRRDYEWKIAFGFWGLIALATQFLYCKPIELPLWALASAALAISVLHGWWLHGVWKAHKDDKSIVDCFRRSAVNLLAERETGTIEIPPKREEVRLVQFLGDWAMRFQLITTVLLGAASVFILGHSGVLKCTC